MQKGTFMYKHAKHLDQATHECTIVMLFAVGQIINEATTDGTAHKSLAQASPESDRDVSFSC